MDEHGRLSRRRFIGAVGAAAGGSLVGAELLTGTALGAGARRPATPNAALAALMEGNRRYRRNEWERRDYSPVGERRASSQKPFAAVLACADSRVSPSLVFDVERGNVFSVQVAGNGVDPGALGSLEYAVAVLRVPLVMVLGHSDCGAVRSAIDVVAGRTSFPPSTFGAIGAVVDTVVPAIESVPAGERTIDRCVATNANVQAQALARTGPILSTAVAAGRLRVVGAVYEIASGRVRLA